MNAGTRIGGGLATLAALALVGPGVARAGDTTGSAGLGDSFFPKSGNGGYDVSHYDVRLRYDPVHNLLQPGTRTIVSAEVTQPAGLTRFDLDFRGPAITELTVRGPDSSVIPSSRTRLGQELVVKLGQIVPSGGAFTVEVGYEGTPRELTDPDGSAEGWVRTDDGASVVGEPRGTPAWMPANDHPTDKATFEISVRVPKGYAAISNGVLESVTREQPPKHRTFHWAEAEPMATYLATATVGRFDRTKELGPPFALYAVDSRLESDGALGRTDEVVDVLEDVLGPYPFSAIGGIVDRGALGYSLETQTRPIYPGPPSSTLVAHEISHQWLGDSVSVADWSEIWLNEGFATWSEWWWDQSQGGRTVAERLADVCALGAGSGAWDPPPGSVPGPEVMFNDGVYTRGGAALQALRELIGDVDFFNLLAAWTARDPMDPASTADLIALVKAETAVPDATIDAHFADWVFDQGKPDACADTRRGVAPYSLPRLAPRR